MATSQVQIAYDPKRAERRVGFARERCDLWVVSERKGAVVTSMLARDSR
jgi:hypothetical protein